MSNWRALIVEEMVAQGDSGPLVSCTLSDEGLDWEFDASHGSENGEPFLAWTKKRVYFPVCYDGAEWVGSAPRKPTKKGQRHVGG